MLRETPLPGRPLHDVRKRPPAPVLPPLHVGLVPTLRVGLPRLRLPDREILRAVNVPQRFQERRVKTPARSDLQRPGQHLLSPPGNTAEQIGEFPPQADEIVSPVIGGPDDRIWNPFLR